MGNSYQHEPSPKPGKQNVADYVLRDIQERIEAGEKKYGCKLQTFNGRDSLWDAYQEALDLVMYLRQAILERENDNNKFVNEMLQRNLSIER